MDEEWVLMFAINIKRKEKKQTQSIYSGSASMLPTSTPQGLPWDFSTILWRAYYTLASQGARDLSKWFYPQITHTKWFYPQITLQVSLKEYPLSWFQHLNQNQQELTQLSQIKGL